MSKVFACLCALMLLVSVSASAAVTTCYPAAADYNTGSTDGAVFTQTSAVNGYNTEDGYIKFDITAVPDEDILSIDFNFYVNTANWPYWSATPITNDPLVTDAATMNADIVAEASTGYYNYQNEASSYAPGWKTLTLGGTANDDLAASLVNDWFAVGVATRDSSSSYYINIDGWAETNVPYIVVTSGAPAVNEACFVADSQATYGIASYTAAITGGFALGSIDWDGMVTELYAGTWGSELTVDISGPLGSATIVLGSGYSYTGPVNFTGSDATFAGLDPVGVWTFDFYETYDDGGDGLPDANWNDICFNFAAPDPCSGPNDCASVELIGAGITSGDTTDCDDTFPSCNLWGWSLLGSDHVYAIDIPCPGTEICVTYTPSGTQDGAIYVTNDCIDGPVTGAVAGADNTLDGEVEAFCYTTSTSDAATMYIHVDTYGAGSAGAYDLEVVVNSPITNDTCDVAMDVTGGGLFSGTTVCAVNDYNGAGCGFSWSSAAPDVAYAITVADGDTVDVAMIPLDGQDPILYMVGDCADPAGTCVAGADVGLGGDPEYITATFDCAGTYYIIADGWSSAEGAFDLDVVVTPAVPVDTFDVGILCTDQVLTLPTMTKIRVGVTNTSAAIRQFCGNVGVTLCNGSHISNIRAGNMVINGGESQNIAWGQNIPANPRTCDCTLVFDVEATDCTPCDVAGAAPAGWTETATCGITTVCP